MTRLCTCIGRLASIVELNKKRNQLSQASCKTCGGRPIVDGIGPLSASMLSTVGLELTNYINPELSWKTVTKGYRSATRRSRCSRSRSLNMSAEPGKRSPKRVWGSSFFESEKLYGQYFTDKIEHVPIKKRKLLLGSPSPSRLISDSQQEESFTPLLQTFSSGFEESKQYQDRKFVSGRCCSPDCFSNQQRNGLNGVVFDSADGLENGVTDGKASKVTSEKHYSNEDFSGIALLAAAACISSIGDGAEKNLVGEELSQPASTSAIPLVENVKSSVVAQKDMVHEGRIDDSCVREDSGSVLHDHKDEECRDVGPSGPTKDVRMFWDLNTVMDGWDQPCDDSTVDFQIDDLVGVAHDVVERIKPENMDQIGSEEIRCDLRSEVQSTRKKASAGIYQLDPHGKCIALSRLKLEECKEKECSGHEGTCEVKYVSRHASVPLTKFSDANTSQVLSVDAVQKSHVVSDKFVSEEKTNVNSAGIASWTKTNDCCSAASLLSKNVSSESNIDDARPLVLTSDKVMHLNSSERGAHEDIGITADMPDKRILHGEEIGTSDKLDLAYMSLKSEDVSGGSFEEQLYALNANGNGEDDNVSGADTIENSSVMHVGPGREQCRSYNENLTAHCEKIPLPFDDIDVSHDVCDHMVVVENMSKLQEGYDSPFEDGELRDPDLYPCDKNVFEDETEKVDYESDDGEGNGFGMSEETEVVSDGVQNMEKGSSLVMAVKDVEFSGRGSSRTSNVHLRHCTGRDDLGMKIEMVGRKGGLVSSGAERSIDMISEANNDNSRKRHTSDEFDRILYIGKFGTKASRGKFPSRIDETSFLDVLDRKDPAFVPRNRSYDFGGPYSRSARDFGSGKSMGRGRSFYMRERSEGNSHWIDSSEGHFIGRNSYRPGYHGPQDPYYTRSRRGFADSGAKVEGFNCHDHYYSIPVPCRQPNGRRSPSDRDDNYPGNRGMAVYRCTNRGGSRGRRGMYSRVCRGFREEYNEVAHDDDAMSVRVRQYLPRGERSSSPFSRGGHMFRSCRRSSRSRTRSPPAWHYQRECNLGAGRHSRSPDFRPEARMERMNFPRQRVNIAADYEELSPPPRSRFPRQHNARWFDAQNYVNDRSRDRRSPVRMSKQKNQRFDPVASSCRSTSDDYNRTMIRPKRITLMAGAGREYKYDDSDEDRRKHDDRYEMMPRARHYDACGAVRRISCHEEDCFEVQNNNNTSNNENYNIRDADRKDVGRNTRGDRGPVRYNNGRIYTTAAPSSGLRVKDEDAALP